MPEINRAINKYLSIERHTNKILINMLLRQTNYVLSVVPKTFKRTQYVAKFYVLRAVYISGDSRLLGL